MRVVVAITGASGLIYGVKLIEVLTDKNIETFVVISESAKIVAQYEYPQLESKLKELNTKIFDNSDVSSPLASGSFLFDAYIIIPCSMKTLSALACGYEGNLIQRLGGISLKEKRKFIIVPRETPLSPIQLSNMLKLARLGVVILFASPAFYHKPSSIEDLVSYIVGKILDQLKISHNIFKRWKQ